MNRKQVLTRLLQIQALIGLAALLWLFFGAGSASDNDDQGEQLTIDTSDLTEDTLISIDRGSYRLVIIKPAAAVMAQIVTARHHEKTTRSEPPVRDYRASANIKVFLLAYSNEHYLLSGVDHWQRDIVCDSLTYQPAPVTDSGPVAAIVCQRSQGASINLGNVIFDAAGRSIASDIADLEMPLYQHSDHKLRITLPQ